MSEPTIRCPSCKTEIKLTESLAAPLIEATRASYEERIATKDAEVAAREDAIKQAQAQIDRARTSIDAQVAERVEAERDTIAAEETKRVERRVAADLAKREKEIAELNSLLAQTDNQLAEAQAAQAEVLKKSRELDDEKRAMALTVQQQIDAGLAAVRESAKTEVESAMTLKVRERDEQISLMNRQIEELKRRSEQGSQQLQGEVQELVLEDSLRARFPFDSIEPVAKGEFGGDVLQRVIGGGGQVCGSILWETKRTKAWSDGWLAKLREDKRAAKADLALIVSQTLPKDIETFGLLDGVWVTGPKCAMAVAVALRESVVLMSATKSAGEGQQTKMGLMYEYLTGPRFRHRIEAVVERVSDMQDGLNRERKMMNRLWAKREQQIHAVVESTAGLYGDLQGIAGKSMLEIDALEMPLIEASDAPESEH